ncbi:S9 family peptidase [Paenibacillus sp. J2TS4]|uniref:alpha/beta hydrolase family protein n=1 Tax=Paenibacillus sp. J2TS4 TaxID=2807194 RepID=UPI001AFDD42E|nr:alpha/beta fold hydrolase [Paenibacillus sp. J2TS4]GIP34724.1 alpha/beta hydrolase [Paenibacillus sp. J2TS4]
MERHFTMQWKEETLTATIHYPVVGDGGKDADHCRWPLVIICHGFIGNRMGTDRLFVKTARQLSRQGFMVIRFDYVGCGESSGEYGAQGLTDLIDQTRRVLDYGLEIDCVDPERVILLGHSLGGAVAVLTAARDKRVRSLVLWAAVANPLSDIVKIVGDRVYEQAIKSGKSDYNGFQLTSHYFESMTGQHPFQEAGRFSGDVLVIHGTADEDVPVDYCFLYQKMFWMRSLGQCDKEVIFQANHTFSSSEQTGQLLEKTTEWLHSINKRREEWNDWMI